MLEIEEESPEKLLHREVTEKIIGSSFEVHRELGYGFLERVYQRALQVELVRGGSAVEIEKRLQVRYKHAVVGDCDLINDCIVELKVNPHDRRDDPAPEPSKGNRNQGRPPDQLRTIKGRVQAPRLLIRVLSVSIRGPMHTA